MGDPRIEKLADILVNYSVEVKEGERVLISGSILARPLIEEIVKKVAQAGAEPVTRITLETAGYLFMKYGSEEIIGRTNEVFLDMIKKCDALISINAPENTKYMSTIDPKRLSLHQKALMPISEYVMGGNVRWVGCNFPVPALAQEAEMSLEEYENFVYSATNIDWVENSKYQDKIKAIFDAGKEVRIVGPGTDLTFSIEGREGIKCDGRNNMPDGEIFYAPIENSANGYITYDFPAMRMGKEVSGIRLEFKDGKVVKASATKNEDFLLSSLDTDEGARYIGEFGIGVNYGIQRFTKDILFDEKIGGTIHLALGRAYPESGGKNVSAIHWDMIKDLRKDGKIILDGKVVAENGKFLIED
ncbi:hypothetical protein BBF96_02105 [Anoxybacter fermentans]|uniref:Peptidase M29 n=1 Tax=Anoxybacter fermentans TaxID=1323375 RepID=A0A3S9SVJ9_9FIRM|nr:aminopeptidase [Anoxybacter fermentans]AZR72292.1 hypothetical protein BBF96_02105 [Anoxybacter fermentans]